MEGLGFELQREAALSALTKDAVKSAAIEGESLPTSGGALVHCPQAWH